MSRFRELARDVAYYFGAGEGSDRMREAQEEASWLDTAVRVVPVLVVAFVLRGVIGLDGFAGFLATLGLVFVLAAVWGLTLRRIRRHRSVPSPGRDR
jgi:hypothetical protein